MIPRPDQGDPFLRQLEILSPADLTGHDVDVVGCGSLGGAIVLCLLKMGFGGAPSLRVWDHDRCETHNLGTQWFRRAHVEVQDLKVDALAETALWICEREIETRATPFTGAGDQPVGRIVILAVDSLAERAKIWSHLRCREDFDLLIDARMGAEVLEIFTVDRKRAAFTSYESSLDDEGDPFEEPCTARAVMYTPFGAGALVGSMVRAFIHGQPFPERFVFDFRNFLMEKA